LIQKWYLLLVLIKCLRESKKYGAKRLLKLFPDRQWNLSGLGKLIRRTDGTEVLIGI